jgi:hypothetical protein
VTTVGSFLLDVDTPVEELLRAGRPAAVGAELTVVVAGLLDLDLGDIAVSAWRKHTALAAAARETVAASHGGRPEVERTVDLARHRITSTHRPYIDVRAGAALVTRVQLELNLVFEVAALAAVVRQGRMVALRTGRCELTGTLSVDGEPVVARRGELDLAEAVRLGEGLVL